MRATTAPGGFRKGKMTSVKYFFVRIRDFWELRWGSQRDLGLGFELGLQDQSWPGPGPERPHREAISWRRECGGALGGSLSLIMSSAGCNISPEWHVLPSAECHLTEVHRQESSYSEGLALVIWVQHHGKLRSERTESKMAKLCRCSSLGAGR